MDEIRIIPKPDWLSWDEIQECIHAAQLTNNKRGFDMLFGHSTGEKLKESLKEGYCLVALNENNKVVGTLSLKIYDIKFWWHKGKAGLQCYEGILPEYRGSEVYFELHEKLDEIEDELGLNVIWATTSEFNEVVKKLQNKQGWKIVQCIASPRNGDYFSVVMVKWKSKCPFTDRRINLMYKISDKLVRLKYKVSDEGKKK